MMKLLIQTPKQPLDQVDERLKSLNAQSRGFESRPNPLT